MDSGGKEKVVGISMNRRRSAGSSIASKLTSIASKVILGTAASASVRDWPASTRRAISSSRRSAHRAAMSLKSSTDSKEKGSIGTLEAWISCDTKLGGAGFRSQSVAGAERELTTITTM
jgi:hypothetical protein